ncbi:MAG: hypothetical protein K1X89_29235 [Myxococcaceae bacterium]|nr:hypothetical protein [Myxococcaceae bacterium]
MTPLGAAFATSRTAEAFRTWAQAEPAAAATWLKTVAGTVGAAPALQAIDAFTRGPVTPAALDALGGVFTQLSTASLGDVQAARAATLGWTAEHTGDAPALTGTVRLEGGEPVLDTTAGSFGLVNGNFFDLENGNWQVNHYLGGRDAVAFAGQTVTVRGWPEAQWTPGARAKLVVEEFAPGDSPDFVSGRVVSDAQGVSVRVRPDKVVKVTDPALAAALAPFDQLGVILPGAPALSGETLEYRAQPDAYYVLAGFLGTPAPQALPGGQERFDLQTAHGRRMQVDFPAGVAEAGPSHGGRHYVFGAFDGGVFKAKSYTPDTGQWTASSGVPVSRTARFAQWATALDAPPPAGTGFALAPATPLAQPSRPSPDSLLALSPQQRWDGYQVGAFTLRRGFGGVYPESAAQLGAPLEDEHGDGADGAVQRFEHGVMRWDPRQGIRVEAQADARAQLLALTQDQRWAGYPVGGFSVVRGFGMAYPELSDRLGAPLENEHQEGGDVVQRFERGLLRWNQTQGVRLE